MNNSKVIVALDLSDVGSALTMALTLDPQQCRLKVGKELFTAAGPKFVERLVAIGFDVFLDLKFHDIPNTVAAACAAAADLGVWMINVHASGGTKMMRVARERLQEKDKPPLLIGVTVLTSMAAEDLHEIGIECSPEEQVVHLAGLVRDAGLDGVVCSAREASILKQQFADDLLLVTPGIRPAGSDQQDQVRITTPAEAVSLGADFLVIGRPITQAADPAAAVVAINSELAK